MNAAQPHLRAPGTAGRAVPDLLSHALMQQALDRGDARHLAPLITDFIHHESRWWITSPDGWLRIDDARLADTLARQHQRFANGLYDTTR